jgi:type IV secretory pathway protease TraF
MAWRFKGNLHHAAMALVVAVIALPLTALAQRSSTTTPAPAAAAPTSSSSAEGRFSTDTAAKAHCPTDTVVWVNLPSKIYHFAGTRDYGRTKSGTYMCEKETAAAGFRAAKNEKHP